MAHLLPTPATELATKNELREEIRDLRSEMNTRFEAINARFDRMFIAQIGGFAALAIAIFLN